ncbi:MAG: molybdopterin-binding protein [Paracoccaceae bacterium]|nr:molybdopterin-binding protein [Paracoccaceae bacterium]
MEFGPVPLSDALGGILAHSVRTGDRLLKKGRVLGDDDIALLKGAGLREITIARLAPDDLDENAAAAAIAAALVPAPEAAGLRLGAASTGRVNIIATRPGLLQLDRDAIRRINATSPEITLATLSPLARVAPDMLVATVKIITYGVGRALVESATQGAERALSVLPVTRQTASLILTRTPGIDDRLLDKGRAAVRARLDALGIALEGTQTTAHDTAKLAAALRSAPGEIILILTGSATSDARDVGPAGLIAAGGRLQRFGLPVDPGNLLFVGTLGARPVIGLPGCARSLALNGADWVLERIACGLECSNETLAQMGIGGLLKEGRARPHPRRRMGTQP